jgi:DNA-binding transcriptional LysR family regulator
VSQRVATLEGELRVALFDRRVGRIALTEAGERLYGLARQIVDLHEQARSELRGVHAAISGELAIAASSVPGECFLPAVFEAFRAKYPDIQLRAAVSDSASVIKEVEKGDVSLGLVGKKAEKSTLAIRAVGQDSLVLVVCPGHPWADCGSIALASLGREPLILREPGSGSRCTLEKSLEAAGISFDELEVAIELGSNAGIKDAVKRGLGVAFLSQFCVQKELASEELKPVVVLGLDLRRQFYLVYHRRRPLSPAANALVHFLESHPLGQLSGAAT